MREKRISRKYKQNQAFTVIELMVVIGIIVVLVGLVFAAMRGTGRATKTLATHGTLNNLAGMLGEIEAAHGMRQPGVWLWTLDGKTITRVPPIATVPGWGSFDFWKGPTRNAVVPATFDPLASPGNVSEEPSSQNSRNGSIAIVNTGLAMTMIAANPANRSRLQAMPQQQQFVLNWPATMSAFGGPITMPGADLFVGYWPSGSQMTDDPSVDLQFVPGVHIRYDGRFYSANPAYVPSTATPAVDNVGWHDETAAPFHAPLLSDAWGNPIIFVPASGIRVRLLNGKKDLDVKDSSQNWIIVSPEGEVINNGNPNPALAPQVTRLGRPFFASAGPDGDFTTGDDNVYSFEK